MELSEKIQKLRKEKGMTQEQLAELLFVSRTAISKWETGRGMPNMASLQMIAKLFGITLDELLSAEEVVAVANEENRENINRFAFRIDGICNTSAVICLFLPLYKVNLNDGFYSVPLYQFRGWLTGLYWLFPAALAICGLIQILMDKSVDEKWKGILCGIGFLLNTAAVFILILSAQPYPGAMMFTFLVIKGTLMLMKQK